MIDHYILTELKARKAKFGFKYDGVNVNAYTTWQTNGNIV